tara:strand:- start:41048 stop:42985 length:1938 start_codon:yes stop_codon:yes gene_type:complete
MIKNAFEVFADAFKSGIKPKEIITVSQWADRFRVLPDKTSAEPGRWNTDRTPYLREIMDELSHMSRAKKVIFKKGAQIGGTEAGNNWLGYIIDQDPSTAMVVWPALPDVQTNTKLRITPLIETTPQLKEKVFDHKGRSQGSSARFKNFQGGAMILTGANSASGLRSVPARFLFLDEIDGYPDDVEGEGDPIALVMARSRTFSRRKAFLCSTPTLKGQSKIDREFRSSDQRFFNVPCPHCNEFQVLIWDQISYELDEDQLIEDDGKEYPVVKKASYFCVHCGEEITESSKTKMLRKGKWVKNNPGSETPGFHLSALYSPVGWYSWKEMAQDFVKAENDPDLLKTWVNTALGEVYEDAGESPKHEILFKRREAYPIGIIPRGVVFLTCAVDVQKDRLEAEVIGWGKRRERWSIEHKVIPGHVTGKEVWDDLEAYLGSHFDHVDGHKLPIMIAGVDSGFETQRVYNFCKRYGPSKVLPLKGREEIQTMVGTPSAVDIKGTSGKKRKRGVRVWPIGINIIKSELYGDLMLSSPTDIMDGFPDGFVHYPMYDQEYFLQLTAEKKIFERDKYGKVKAKWKKIRERNEILDLHVYNRALSFIAGVDRLNESGWESLEQKQKLASPLTPVENRKQELSDKKKKRKTKKSNYWD